MSGSIAGGRKAYRTNVQRHGEDFYRRIGQKGGLVSRGGGFAANRELARIVGAKGGRMSKPWASMRRKKSLEDKVMSLKTDYEEPARALKRKGKK